MSELIVFSWDFYGIFMAIFYSSEDGVIFGHWGKYHKVMLHTRYHGSRPYGSRQEDFFMFLPF